MPGSKWHPRLIEAKAIYGSRRWKNLRHLAMTRAGWLCVRCAERGLTVAAEEVHHLVGLHTRRGIEIARLFRIEDVVALCRPCHRRLDPRHKPDGPPGETPAAKQLRKGFETLIGPDEPVSR